MTEVVSAFTTGITGASDSIMDFVVIVVPVAVGILAVTLAVKFGIKFFKGLVGRA